ncbi:unnamed protein product, partial [marine sediment metagenome]
MGSNGKGADVSKKVQVFVARHETKKFTKIVVVDADGKQTLVEMRIPDAVVYSQIDALDEGGDVLKSLRSVLGI